MMHLRAAAPAASLHSWIGTRRPMLIDGEWVHAVIGATLKVVNPASEEVIAEIASADATDIDRAVKAARRAFEGDAWRSLRPMDREALLHRLADLIEQHADELALLETLDNGKPMVAARTRDVANAVKRLRYVAGWPSKLEGRTLVPSVEPNMDLHAYTVLEPVGVVGQIIAWNYPLQMAIGKLAPALAAGCTSVLKPAEQTSLTALRLGELIVKAGFPPGVVNIVTGTGEVAGAALVDHPDIDKVAFTGSSAVGRLIGSKALSRMKRVSLELGGKSPVIVGPGADLDAATRGAATAIFSNMGQACVAGSRLYVHESVFDRVVDGLVERARALKIGNGLETTTQQGPLVSQVQMDRVLGYVDIARSEGGTVLTGGRRHGTQGYFVEPTVLSNLGRDSRCVQEEIFGPVVIATPYREVDELASLANDTEYGLAASIWSRDIGFAHKLARRIRAGTVWLNCHSLLDSTMPFGGFRQSGVGRESGGDGVRLYTETKTIVSLL